MRLALLTPVAAIVLSACQSGGFRAPAAPADPRAPAVVYSPGYRIRLLGLERLHPFDIRKYDRIYRALEEDGSLDSAAVIEPEPLPDSDILRVQNEAFLESLHHPRTVAAYLEAPAAALVPAPLLERGMIKPFRLASGGTLLAGREALRRGLAINLGGGYHHAKPDRGEGFCLFADIPIAIQRLRADGLIRRAAVIDLDVHQGNGTALCLAGDAEAFTFSMHQGDIYPIPKEHGDLDVELAAGTGDAEFLATLDQHLNPALDRARPDIVFYVAGCDTLAGDPLASLTMTAGGIVARDRRVIGACRLRGIPVVVTLGGGYSEHAWEAQFQSIRAILQDCLALRL
ncbi:MAG: histone deacetylase [Verrucomicrobiales bacterium]